MSLGGYKFAGKYCEKGSLTDVQWALLMHKTKVAAFMAANALSNAGWDYDMAGSPDGNYHCLDSVGNNYVTCFKRVVDESTTHYFAIYTLCCFGPTADAGTGRIEWTPWVYNTRMGPNASYFARIGTSHIDYSDGPGTAISGVTDICAMGNPGSLVSTASYTGAHGQANTYFSLSTNYYGFAVKGSDLIVISGGSPLCVSVLSASAFSTFFNSGDAQGAFLMNMQPISSTAPSAWYESATRSSVSGYGCSYSLASKYDGTAKPAMTALLPIANYSGAVQSYPYQTLTALNVASNGCSGKGVINIELLAANMQGSSSDVPVAMQSYANGNYLCVSEASLFTTNTINKMSNTSSTLNAYTALYVGWDPSNPDITQASSWQLYDGT